MTDLTSMDPRVIEINCEAEKMMKAGHPQSGKIKNRQQQLNDRSGGNLVQCVCLGKG